MKTTSFLVLFACFAICAYGRTLTENLLLNHFVEFVQSESLSSGAFLYDTALGGPGGVPSYLNDRAQSLAEDVATNQVAFTGADLSTAVATVKTDIMGAPCAFTQYISPSRLSTELVNVYDNVKLFSYYGPYASFSRYYQAIKRNGANTTDANTIRRLLTCPLFDNLAFGIKFDGAVNLAFVIIGVASDSTSKCSTNNKILSPTPNYFCPSECARVASTSEGITHIPTPANVTKSYSLNSTDALLWLESSFEISANYAGVSFTTVDEYVFDKTSGLAFTTPSPYTDTGNSKKLAGINVVSWLLQFYPGKVGAPISVNGSVTFSNQIVGVIFSDASTYNSGLNRLKLSDPTFQTACVPYASPDIVNAHRGLEAQKVGKNILRDSFTAIGNTFTINNFTQPKVAYDDQVRIITACEDGPMCDNYVKNATKVVRMIYPPMSVEAYPRNSLGILLFKERSLILSEPLPVDALVTAGAAFTYNFDKNEVQSYLPAGNGITSWYLFAKPVVNAVSTKYTARVTFGDPVTALIYASSVAFNNVNTLYDTDSELGGICTEYSTINTADSRGLEVGDNILIDSTNRIVDISFNVQMAKRDDLRVLTLCTPGGNT